MIIDQNKTKISLEKYIKNQLFSEKNIFYLSVRSRFIQIVCTAIMTMTYQYCFLNYTHKRCVYEPVFIMF